LRAQLASEVTPPSGERRRQVGFLGERVAVAVPEGVVEPEGVPVAVLLGVPVEEDEAVPLTELEGVPEEVLLAVPVPDDEDVPVWEGELVSERVREGVRVCVRGGDTEAEREGVASGVSEREGVASAVSVGVGSGVEDAVAVKEAGAPRTYRRTSPGSEAV
jgi:hypothetical protein